MSRCFPYHPPGFSGKSTRDVDVIESIKREEKARTVRREEKKLKKERRKGKKQEKEKTRRNGEIGLQKDGHKKRLKEDMSQEDRIRWTHQNSRESETDHFEKSSLTDEHGHSIDSENICYSSDGSLNSNKRQKYSSPPNGRLNTGNTFWIRLPLQRHKDQEPALERTDVIKQEMCNPVPKPGRRKEERLCYASGITIQGLDLKSGKENPRHSSAAAEIFYQKPEIASASMSSGRNSSLLELRFMELLEYWAPPVVQSQWSASDNQDWLLETKENYNIAPEKRETNRDGMSHGNSAPWPRVCYLPEVDIYALPFTVPF